MPKISIIVPVYKVEKYIHQCIDSILKQTFTDIELILVDDGSPDSCGKICDEYAVKDRRVKVIHKENGGLSDARNTGVKCAKGEYISFVDSDDWIAPNALEEALWQMLKNEVDMLKFGFIKTDGRKSKTVTFKENKIFDKDLFGKYFDGVLWTIAWGTLYKAELAKKVLFPEKISHKEN